MKTQTTDAPKVAIKQAFSLAVAEALNKRIFVDRDVEIRDEFGKPATFAVKIRRMTHLEIVNFEAPSLEEDPKVVLDAAKTGKLRMLQACLCNDDETLMFPDKNNIDALRNMPFETVNALYMEAYDVNPWGPRRARAVEQAVKN